MQTQNSNEQQAIDALKNVALEGIKEQRRARRWNIFFRFVFLALGAIFVISGLVNMTIMQSSTLVNTKEFTAVIEVKGVIMDGGDVSLAELSPVLIRAFEDERTQGIILLINSPGGSAVQSALIFDEIQRLKEKHQDMPVYAVIQDVGASGGYYIAAAADEVFANPSSIVGSIGVRLDSYGVIELAKKVGIENRTITAGENKTILDPFAPVSTEDETHLKRMLASTHEQFIAAVKQGRGDRLKPTDDIFSGLFWAGKEALALGLIDGYKTEYQVANELVGAETMKNFTPKKSIFEEFINTAISVLMSQPQMLVKHQL